MIVLCHFLQYYGNELAWWFNVGVQIFFVLSGFLYGQKDIQNSIDFLIKQLKKILIPYWIFLFAASVLYAFFDKENISPGVFVYSLLCARTVKGLEHLWFVPYILFCYFVTPYLNDLRKKLENFSIVKFIAVFASVFFAGQIVAILFNSYFDFARVNCYIFGYFLSAAQAIYGKKIIKYSCVFVSIFAVFANALKVYLKYIKSFSSEGMIGLLYNYFLSYTHLLLGAALFLIIYVLTDKMKQNTLLRVSDKYSYCIYLVHQLFILSSFSLVELTGSVTINVLLTLIVVFVFAFLLYHISKPAYKAVDFITNKILSSNWRSMSQL